MKIAIIICVALSLSACKNEPPVLEIYTTKSEFSDFIKTVELSQKKINDLELTISIQADLLAKQIDKIETLATKSDVNKHYLYIKSLRNIDLDSIEKMKESLILMQSQLNKNKAVAAKVKTKKKPRHKKTKVIKDALNVAVYNVNSWGDGYVAVIFTKENGYQTVTKNQFVSDGWEVSEIKPNRVSFTHRSGKRVSVNI